MNHDNDDVIESHADAPLYDDEGDARRVLFPDLSDDDVGMALLAEEWDPARELPPLEPLCWPPEEAAAAAAVLRLGLWATRRAGALRSPILEALHALQGQILRVSDRRQRSAAARARSCAPR